MVFCLENNDMCGLMVAGYLNIGILKDFRDENRGIPNLRFPR